MGLQSVQATQRNQLSSRFAQLNTVNSIVASRKTVMNGGLDYLAPKEKQINTSVLRARPKYITPINFDSRKASILKMKGSPSQKMRSSSTKRQKISKRPKLMKILNKDRVANRQSIFNCLNDSKLSLSSYEEEVKLGDESTPLIPSHPSSQPGLGPPPKRPKLQVFSKQSNSGLPVDHSMVIQESQIEEAFTSNQTSRTNVNLEAMLHSREIPQRAQLPIAEIPPP